MHRYERNFPQNRSFSQLFHEASAALNAVRSCERCLEQPAGACQCSRLQLQPFPGCGAGLAPQNLPGVSGRSSWKRSLGCDSIPAALSAPLGVINPKYPSWRVQKSCPDGSKTLDFALTWFLAAKDPSAEPQMFISSALGPRDAGLL